MTASYHRPETLADALAVRAAQPEFTVLAGGTDLLVAHNTKPEPPGIIDLFGMPEVTGISQQDGWLRIGGATTYKAILESKLCQSEASILCQAAREVGALQIQARGTLAGNIQTSSPVGDTLPVLLALDAEIEVASVRGNRRIPYPDFITGYRKTALSSDELIVAVWLPPRPPGLKTQWRKVGTRRAQSISKVMFAGAAVIENGVFSTLRLALGAVADRTIRIIDAEQAALGKPADQATADLVAEKTTAAIRPISDVRSTAQYRHTVGANLCRRFILDNRP